MRPGAEPLKKSDLRWLMDVIGEGVVKTMAPLRDRIAAVEKAGVTDVGVVYDGQRNFTLRFNIGDGTKEFSFILPIVLDRGVYREAAEYQRGDGVTHGGSYWIALGNTKDRPGAGSGWRLAVKRGQDGKDYRPAVSL